MASSLYRLANKPHPCELQPEPVIADTVGQLDEVVTNFEVPAIPAETSLTEPDTITFSEELTVPADEVVEEATLNNEALEQVNILPDIIAAQASESQEKLDTTKTSKTKKKY